MPFLIYVFACLILAPFGLLMGAVWPPSLYQSERAKAIAYNIIGYLVYIIPGSMLWGICFHFEGNATPLELFATATGIFVGVEALTLLLVTLMRTLRRRK